MQQTEKAKSKRLSWDLEKQIIEQASSVVPKL